MFQLQIMIEKRTPDLLTPSTTFHDVSVLRNCFSKTEMRQFGASRTDGLKESKKRILKQTTGYNNLLTQVRAQNDGNLRKTERSTKVGEHAGRSSKRSI